MLLWITQLLDEADKGLRHHSKAKIDDEFPDIYQDTTMIWVMNEAIENLKVENSKLGQTHWENIDKAQSDWDEAIWIIQDLWLHNAQKESQHQDALARLKESMTTQQTELQKENSFLKD